ncbi:MAG: bifunctional homocysteine S-methyltransferase/methylenetetrahydrofolate reductase [Acidobacteria bacterium]|nr:bifunctional homocysteine S-methyltransferase/methylenetetrahydrofolate reductase [Acidobacteriota bacterium]MBV9477288.1 bifunctional homocysteine S-methyltransferase/methylenetetrahydrofolate reductase [Acidobacteriota bacterium]
MEFIQAIADEHVYLFDGAMGTMLYAKGVFINKCYDELNVRSPEIVLEVHRQYVRAGAEILETNTYGANRVKLQSFGIEDELRDINLRAAEIARKAAGDSVYVAGAMGPLGIRIEPYGPMALDEARGIFREQAEALRDGGVDLFVLETFSNLSEIEQALEAVRDVCSLPVIAQVTIGTDGRTVFGDTPRVIAQRLDRAGVDVIGLNCSVGPDVMLDAIEEMAAVTAKKISCQPNAGLPRDVNGRQMYMASPDYFGKYAKRLIHKGVKFIGGCCGTTPEHIKVMADAVRPLSPRRAFVVVENDPAADKPAGREPVPMCDRSRWGEKLARGTFVTTIEITPPKGANADAMVRSVESIRAAGVDAVNVPDGPRAQNRMGAIAVAVLLQQRVGIEAVLHYCCRDRNLLGMHSDLLGCAALGVHNLLLITGDPPKMGPYPEATAVFDIDSIGLTNMVSLMNRGLDLGGNPFGDATCFTIGVGVNPGHLDLDYELRRLDWKVKAGAEYAITQPVFDVRQLEHFLARIEHLHLPVVAGIWPLLSYRNAQFMNNEVPGVSVPDDVMERMRIASEKGKEFALVEGVTIARETLARVRERVAGVQVSAPLGRVDLALQVFDGLVEKRVSAS